MENLYDQNKNEVWDFLKSMKSQKKGEAFPELDILIDHFKTLFIKETNDEPEYTNKPNNENTKKFDILNTIISEDEFKNGIKNLKPRTHQGLTVSLMK